MVRCLWFLEETRFPAGPGTRAGAAEQRSLDPRGGRSSCSGKAAITYLP
jgi:hypothetical protein